MSSNPQGRPNTTLLFFFFFFLHHEARWKEREMENSEGERVEVGGGVEMNGSGGFIGCCQGG